MSKLTKVVNIYPSMPITGVNPPIRSTVKRVTKSISEIRTCLMARAIVEEILPNGEIIKLDNSNYDKFLTPHMDKKSCACCCCEKIESSVIEDVKAEENAIWKAAYDNALEGKNLAMMTRKQRRSAEAAARAVADAAVNSSKSEVINNTVDITEDGELLILEESIEIKEEEKVETIDVETIIE